MSGKMPLTVAHLFAGFGVLWMHYYGRHKQFSLLPVVCLKFMHLRVWFDLDESFQRTKYIHTLLNASMTPSSLVLSEHKQWHTNSSQSQMPLWQMSHSHTTLGPRPVLCAGPPQFLFSLSVSLIQ